MKRDKYPTSEIAQFMPKSYKIHIFHFNHASPHTSKNSKITRIETARAYHTNDTQTTESKVTHSLLGNFTNFLSRVSADHSCEASSCNCDSLDNRRFVRGDGNLAERWTKERCNKYTRELVLSLIVASLIHTSSSQHSMLLFVGYPWSAHTIVGSILDYKSLMNQEVMDIARRHNLALLCDPR